MNTTSALIVSPHGSLVRTAVEFSVAIVVNTVCMFAVERAAAELTAMDAINMGVIMMGMMDVWKGKWEV